MISIHKTDQNGTRTEIKLDTPTKVVVVGSVLIAAAGAVIALVKFAAFLATF